CCDHRRLTVRSSQFAVRSFGAARIVYIFRIYFYLQMDRRPAALRLLATRSSVRAVDCGGQPPTAVRTAEGRCPPLVASHLRDCDFCLFLSVHLVARLALCIFWSERDGRVHSRARHAVLQDRRAQRDNDVGARSVLRSSVLVCRNREIWNVQQMGWNV